MDQLPFIIDTVPFENMHYTVWKIKKLSLSEQIFRDINALVTSFVKTLISRNFCKKKSVKVIFRNFYTVQY